MFQDENKELVFYINIQQSDIKSIRIINGKKFDFCHIYEVLIC